MKHCPRFWLPALGALAALAAGQLAHADALQSGVASFTALPGEESLPDRFQLSDHQFSYQLRPLGFVSKKLSVSYLTFPSAVETPHPKNNVVHCEYFRPSAATSDSPAPAVVVLHILGGDFELARLFCNALALEGTAALFLKMPYYGPRRDPQSRRRMISKDPHETVKGMTQAVLDIRRAAAWLDSREEIDSARLGIFGISLGGITASLAAGVEPRFTQVCAMLAGGDIGQIGWESKKLSDVRESWLAAGKTKQEFLEVMRKIDPVEFAPSLRDRRVLMLNAKNDEVVPPSCTISLWKAMGRPEIVWYDCGHYSAIRFIFSAIGRVRQFFSPNSS